MGRVSLVLASPVKFDDALVEERDEWKEISRAVPGIRVENVDGIELAS